MQTTILRGELLNVYIALLPAPATMRMIEVSTGILRPNICRHIAKLKRMGLVTLKEKKTCPYTSRIAGFYLAY